MTDECCFLLTFAAAFKQFLIDVMAELYGTNADQIDPEKLNNMDPETDAFMEDVKTLLSDTQNLEIDEDKPLTYRLLKQIQANEILNKKRAVLESFYLLKKDSIKLQRPIIVDKHGNFRLGKLLLNSGGDAVQDPIVEGTG
jgi:hypothetical protein